MTDFNTHPPGSGAEPASADRADVLIVGAGPAGLSLACALSDAGLTVTLLEQQSRGALAAPQDDGREIAITHRARRIMQELGFWGHVPEADIAPLRQARVRDGGSSSLLSFSPTDTATETLGWLLPNHAIRHAAWAAVQQRKGIRVECEARVTGLELGASQACIRLADGRLLSADLVVAADSRFSSVRRMAGIGAFMRDFGRSVVVGRVGHEREHQGIAWECFDYGNTLALLPLNQSQCSAVVTVDSHRAVEWLALSEAAFAARVEAQAFKQLGHVQALGARHHYPLVSAYAQRFVAPRFALVGDAAVGMHPVTAHGWNFGLYGLEVLAAQLKAARWAGHDLGALATLLPYEHEHRRATLPVYLGTNAVVSLFTDERRLPKLARQAVMAAASGLPPLRDGLRAAISRQLTRPEPPERMRWPMPPLPPLPALTKLGGFHWPTGPKT